MSHRCRIMKEPQAPPVGRRRRPRQGSSSERDPPGYRPTASGTRGGGGGGGPAKRGAGAAFFAFLSGSWGWNRSLTRGFAGKGFGVCAVWCSPCRTPGQENERTGMPLPFRRRAQRPAAPCSSGQTVQQLLAPARLPAPYPRTLPGRPRPSVSRGRPLRAARCYIWLSLSWEAKIDSYPCDQSGGMRQGRGSWCAQRAGRPLTTFPVFSVGCGWAV